LGFWAIEVSSASLYPLPKLSAHRISLTKTPELVSRAEFHEMEKKIKLLEMDVTSLEYRLNTIQLENIRGRYSFLNKASSPDLSGGSDNNDDSDGESAQSLFSKWFKRSKRKTKRSTFSSQINTRLVRRPTVKSSEEPSHSPQIITFSSQPDETVLPSLSYYYGRPSSTSYIPSPTHSRDSGSCVSFTMMAYVVSFFSLRLAKSCD
jgi:hypothetical protein